MAVWTGRPAAAAAAGRPRAARNTARVRRMAQTFADLPDVSSLHGGFRPSGTPSGHGQRLGGLPPVLVAARRQPVLLRLLTDHPVGAVQEDLRLPLAEAGEEREHGVEVDRPRTSRMDLEDVAAEGEVEQKPEDRSHDRPEA